MSFPYEFPREHIDQTKTHQHRAEIISEFASIINKHSLENDSNTPDFILAEYLYDCLITAHILICARSIWFNPKGIYDNDK